MAEGAPNEFLIYSSVYRHGVDEKRRVQIPSKWRPSSGEVQFTLFIWPRRAARESCLVVLPPTEMLRLLQKLREMPLSDPKAEALRRSLGANSDQIVLDKAGRLCLPEQMAKAVEIGKEAVLSGMMDHFAIWNPEAFGRAQKADEEHQPDAFRLI